MVDELRNFERNDPDMELRILLHGPVGSGKSSFIASLNNIFQGRQAAGALAANNEGKSFTNTYRNHYIKSARSPNGRLPFVFNDVMGLEKGRAVHAEDIINAMKGRIKPGYTFNPIMPIEDSSRGELKPNPELSDKAHCLVSVVDINNISIMGQDVIDKMKMISAAASSLKIPHVIVMTKPDLACELVKNDVKNIYTSKIIKQKMETCSSRLGVPMECILPVKNYHESIDLDKETDVLLLNAMTKIVNFANVYVGNPQQGESDKNRTK